jgi:hypothetical protein
VWGRQVGGQEGATARQRRSGAERCSVYPTTWTGAKLNNEQENSVNHYRIEENMHSRSSTPGGDRECNVHRLQMSWAHLELESAKHWHTAEHLQHEKSVCQVTWGSQPPLSAVIDSDGTWVRSLVVHALPDGTHSGGKERVDAPSTYCSPPCVACRDTRQQCAARSDTNCSLRSCSFSASDITFRGQHLYAADPTDCVCPVASHHRLGTDPL